MSKKHSEQDKLYYQKNKEKILKRQRERYYENIEYERSRRHIRYMNHKDDELAKQKLRSTPETRHEYWIRYSTQAKTDFIKMYGSVCSCCGEDIPEFLTIEHIQGQRGIHHKQKRKSTRAYREAITEYRPDLYEILCYNCNCAKGALGVCPHKSKKRTED